MLFSSIYETAHIKKNFLKKNQTEVPHPNCNSFYDLSTVKLYKAKKILEFFWANFAISMVIHAIQIWTATKLHRATRKRRKREEKYIGKYIK